MYSHVYWITESVHNIFSMELNTMQIFSFTYSCDKYQKSFEKKPLWSYCNISAIQSLQNQNSLKDQPYLETFHQFNIDILHILNIFKFVKLFLKVLLMNPNWILKKRIVNHLKFLTVRLGLRVYVSGKVTERE